MFTASEVSPRAAKLQQPHARLIDLDQCPAPLPLAASAALIQINSGLFAPVNLKPCSRLTQKATMFIDVVVLAGIGTLGLMVAFFAGVGYFIWKDSHKRKQG